MRLLSELPRNAFIRENEVGFLFRSGRFDRLLRPGRLPRPFNRSAYQVSIHDRLSLELDRALADALWAARPRALSDKLLYVEPSADAVGLIERNSVIRRIVAPGERAVFWNDGATVVSAEAISDDPVIPKSLAKRFNHVGDSAMLKIVDVDMDDAAFLFVDNLLRGTLPPGKHYLWTRPFQTEVKRLNTRPTVAGLSGQELLTKDRVTIRLNVDVFYRIADAEKTLLAVGDWSKYFHAAAQAALRSVLSAQTLETLLQDASAMEGPIRDLLATPSTEIGIAIDRVSVKDVILPGEMRTLMMTVLEAEKRAQAAAIRRREETAETRSMLNTAKVMENNPLLLRLKELETLERVTERIGNITVFGGLDDVMNKLVQIGSRKTSEEAP